MDENIPILMPKRIPNELICDLFIALDRNEMEKCQLVSIKWRQIVDEHGRILPLRRIYRLFLRKKPTRRAISCYPIATFQVDPCFNCNILNPIEFNGNNLTPSPEFFRKSEKKSEFFKKIQLWFYIIFKFSGDTSEVEIARAKSLKHCVFNWCQFYCDVVRDEAPCEEAIKLLERITMMAGQKLRAIKVDHSRIATNQLDTLKKFIDFDKTEHVGFSWMDVEEDF